MAMPPHAPRSLDDAREAVPYPTDDATILITIKTTAMSNEKKSRVMLEMRPAFDGFAGIPQETRLLFRALCDVEWVELSGLLQRSLRFLAAGMPTVRTAAAADETKRLNRYSRFIVSANPKPAADLRSQIRLWLKKYVTKKRLDLSARIRGLDTVIPTTYFEARHFENFVWQTLFAKSLRPEDFPIVTSRDHRICEVPWNLMQTVGLNSTTDPVAARYPKIDTTGADVFIAQTPYPGRVSDETALVVRYHDALPVFMPHHFPNQSRHQAAHFRALASNARDGAYFACVSDATRYDLLRLFPQTEARCVTIHNIVSPIYFRADSLPAHAAAIINARVNRGLLSKLEITSGVPVEPATSCRYLLIVSTIEPRKNHECLIAASEKYRIEIDTSMKLVVVGNPGWDYDAIIDKMRPGIASGNLFVLSHVPASDLRTLYRHAAATVCPSFAEGFDFSGVESMRSGGITIASDIPVHREVYEDAAAYFNPYDSDDLFATLVRVLATDESTDLRRTMLETGDIVSRRYTAERILPAWEALLERVLTERHRLR